jgi:alkylation response protein AidB-like acyl-CoA dehydrogenase
LRARFILKEIIMNTIKQKNISDEEIEAFKDLAIDFSAKELLDEVEEHDKFPHGDFFIKTVLKAGEVGFYSINLPEEFEGVDMGMTPLAVILENISKVDASMAGIIFTNAAAIEIVNQAPKDIDSSVIYKKILEEEMPLAFHSSAGLEEIDFPLLSNELTLSGKLNFLVMGGVSTFAVIPVKKENEEKITYCFVDLNEKGVIKSETVNTLGLHACPSVDVTFENVPVVIIGEAGEGEKYFNAMQKMMSVSSAAISLGIMKGAFEEAFEYTKERFQGGRQIIDWSEVRMLLANFAIEIESGESSLANACRELDSETGRGGYKSLASAINISEMACRATVDGVQLLGGNGYMKDYGQEKRMRDAKQVESFLGMSKIRKINFISQMIEDSK